MAQSVGNIVTGCMEFSATKLPVPDIGPVGMVLPRNNSVLEDFFTTKTPTPVTGQKM
jgi:hypothetical protein